MDQKGNAANSAAAAAGVGVGNKNYHGNDESTDREATKRLAQQGQWRTPPLPVFARSAYASASASASASAAAAAVVPPVAPASASASAAAPTTAAAAAVAGKIPTTPDEYARMLQEAYKRGAEAGARAQHPVAAKQRPAAAVVGVDVGVMPPPAAVQYAAAPTTTTMAAGAAAVAQRQRGMALGMTTTPMTQGVGVGGMQVNNYALSTTTTTNQAPSNPPGGGPAIAHGQHHTTTMPPTNSSSAAVSHSKSLPDMSSYQTTMAGVHDEEDKRKKRLARNRASARLRRLKKKNLVDSYEGEVGVLESALSKLRAHRWGSTTSSSSTADGNGRSNSSNNAGHHHEALVEALSMERGQQPLTPAARRERVGSIVAQQREQVGNLLECQLENWMLSVAVAEEDPSIGGGAGGATTTTVVDGITGTSGGGGTSDADAERELNELAAELRSVLRLTPEQTSLIRQSSRGCVHEVQDLFTVDDCLQSIQKNEWLLDEGVDEVAGQFTSILNPSQLSKFLLWSDHNADPIEKLDYVNVTAGGAVGSGPVFEFGVDEGLADGD